MMKNACTVLMGSRGTPMFLAGDEFANTQYGNNNPYCQDNEISWLNWTNITKNQELFNFFKQAIQFRKDHSVVRRDLSPSRLGYPSVSTYTAENGTEGVSSQTKVLGVLYAGYDEEKQSEDVVFLAVNVFWEECNITLPKLPDDMHWEIEINTMGDIEQSADAKKNIANRGEYTLAPRTTAIFVGKWGKKHKYA